MHASTEDATHASQQLHTESQIQKHVDKIVKHLIDVKDLQRVRVLSTPQTPPPKGVKEKLLPPLIPKRGSDPLAQCPISEEEILKLPSVAAIVAIRKYESNESLRAKAFAKKIAEAMAYPHANATTIRSAIEKFLRMYPPELPYNHKERP